MSFLQLSLYDHRSLCRVDSSGDSPWLIRLADYSNDSLTSVTIDPHKQKKFDNRDRLYHDNGPTTNGFIGVWDWSASPQYNDPERDHIDSAYCPDIIPTEVYIIKGCNDTDSLVSALQSGIRFCPSAERILFSVYVGDGTYTGVLCALDDLEVLDDKVKLSKYTHSLPQYSFTALNLIVIEEKKFYRNAILGPETKWVSIGNPLDAVKKNLLIRMKWKAAKQKGFIKLEWRRIKGFVEALETEDFYQSVMEDCGCSLAEAHSYTAQLLEKAESSINLEDVDSGVLAMIAMNHSELRKKCMELLTEEWALEHREEINRSKEEENTIRKSISALRTEHSTLSEQNAQLQASLDTADALIQEREQFAKDVEKKVEARIAAAKKNAADFICEMAFAAPYVIPESKRKESSGAASRGLLRGTMLDKEEPEVLEDWQDTLNAIYENLKGAGVADQHQYELSAFLYSCYLNHFPVLLAGPNGREIADALSAVLTGRFADYLDCSECQYGVVLPEIDSLEHSVLVCDHPFVSNWVEHLPEFSRKQNVFTVFVHPYKEDLAVEPGGIVNYMIPLLTELFVDRVPTYDYYPCCRSEEYKEFPGQKLFHRHQKLFTRLRTAPIVRNKLQRVLTDLRSMCNAQNDDHDLALCLAPLAYLTDKSDLLSETLKESGSRSLQLTSEVKDLIISMLGIEE